MRQEASSSEDGKAGSEKAIATSVTKPRIRKIQSRVVTLAGAEGAASMKWWESTRWGRRMRLGGIFELQIAPVGPIAGRVAGGARVRDEFKFALARRQRHAELMQTAVGGGGEGLQQATEKLPFLSVRTAPANDERGAIARTRIGRRVGALAQAEAAAEMGGAGRRPVHQRGRRVGEVFQTTLRERQVRAERDAAAHEGQRTFRRAERQAGQAGIGGGGEGGELEG